jgi:hypothetical protein
MKESDVRAPAGAEGDAGGRDNPFGVSADPGGGGPGGPGGGGAGDGSPGGPGGGGPAEPGGPGGGGAPGGPSGRPPGTPALGDEETLSGGAASIACVRACFTSKDVKWVGVSLGASPRARKISRCVCSSTQANEHHLP